MMQVEESLASQTEARHDKEEQEHFDTVCESFRQYATFAMCHWRNQQHRWEALPESQRRLLPTGVPVEERADNFREAAIRNQYIIDCILKHAGRPHSQQQQQRQTFFVSDHQVSKVSSVLKSLVRDWSLEGKRERDMAYVPILKSVGKYVPISNTREAPRICVPGAGVGRLAWELVGQGYKVQGNEFSLHMLLASDFILNGGLCTSGHPLAISPWLLESRNVHSFSDTVRKVMIPDVDPSSVLSPDKEADFSMAAGDFVSIYADPSQQGAWDAVVCCFFMDAAPCLIQYIQVIHAMLAKGGVLISFGPLLFHWNGPTMRPDDRSFDAYHARFRHLDPRYIESVDFSWQDVREILVNVGFVIEEEHTGIESLYTADVKSMMTVSYRCVHFVARKPKADSGKEDMV